MPYILKGHVPYAPKAPEPAKPEKRVSNLFTYTKTRESLTPAQREQLDTALIKGHPTKYVMAEFGINNNSIQSRKSWLKRNGFLEKSA